MSDNDEQRRDYREYKDTHPYVSLREYLERKNDLHWFAHGREHELLAQQVITTEKALDIRLESMNAFRQQISDQAHTFVARDSLDSREQLIKDDAGRLDDRLGKIERWQAAVDAKFWALGVGFSIFVVALNLITRYIFPQH